MGSTDTMRVATATVARPAADPSAGAAVTGRLPDVAPHVISPHVIAPCVDAVPQHGTRRDDAFGPSRESGRECEKSGLVEALLARERYTSILEIGCGDGGFARLVTDRCASYTGLDVDASALVAARCRIRAGARLRFLPLAPPFRLPSGEHELVVISALPLPLGPGAVEDIARRLAAHAPCRELVVVGASDGDTDGEAGGGEPTIGRFAAAFGERFVHRELARRRHYRIDALLRASG